MECEYAASLSLAIQQTDRACNKLQEVVEAAKKDNDTETLAVYQDTLLINQKAVVDMTKQKRSIKRHAIFAAQPSSAKSALKLLTGIKMPIELLDETKCPQMSCLWIRIQPHRLRLYSHGN